MFFEQHNSEHYIFVCVSDDERMLNIGDMGDDVTTVNPDITRSTVLKLYGLISSPITKSKVIKRNCIWVN